MNGYEIFAELIKGNKGGNAIALGTMISTSACKIGNLTLDRTDLYIPDHLVSGYQITEYTRAAGLKAGDIVAIYRLNDEKYIILARVI